MFLTRDHHHSKKILDSQQSNVKMLHKSSQQYVEGKINESVERRHFRQRRQQPGESFDDFLLRLRKLAKTCNFCTEECAQKSIRDQTVEGLLDSDAIEHLLKERELTLDAAILKCCAQEATTALL